MENSLFQIQLDAATGGIRSLRRKDDPHEMNWIADGCIWGLKEQYHRIAQREDFETSNRLQMVSFEESAERAVSIYSNGRLEMCVERSFSENGNLLERYTMINVDAVDQFLEPDTFGITLPFHDRYTNADECMIHHCNTHIWCGYQTAYIQAEKMGDSRHNIGLILKRGAVDSYSVRDVDSNCRGIFVWNIAHTELLPGEKTVLEWEIFPWSDQQDFLEKMRKQPSFVEIQAKQYTVFQGEPIAFSVFHKGEAPVTRVELDGNAIDIKQGEQWDSVFWMPQRLGAHRFWIQVGDCRTYADFYVSFPFEDLVEKRLDFIIRNQQYHRPGSRLDGAFLVYDLEERHVIFHDGWSDHNACRERLGMALLLTAWLKKHPNPQWQKCLMDYVDFMYREFFDAKTGRVFNSVGKREKVVRLYNAPWVATFLAELYHLTGDNRYLDDDLVLLDHYYASGGSRFYPNGFSFAQIYRAYQAANRQEDAVHVLELFREHGRNMAETGTSYPKHEVNYEQTIVTPASSLLSDLGILTGEPYWAEKARPHLVNLERFNGHQPSCHLYEIPIRYWDDYWFGKAQQFGDTFPHYWSCLSARAFLDYYHLTGETSYRDKAEACIRNCLCLFDDQGAGSCAYVFPRWVNDMRGAGYDPWANDQDFALYVAMLMEEKEN